MVKDENVLIAVAIEVGHSHRSDGIVAAQGGRRAGEGGRNVGCGKLARRGKRAVDQ